MKNARVRQKASAHLIAALLLSLGSTWLQAADSQPYPAIEKLDLAQLLPSPPPLNSPEQAGEVAAILAAQQAANPARLKQAEADAKGSVFDMFGAPLGAKFTPTNLPKTAELFARLGASEAAVVGPAQKVFDRTRPFLADNRVNVLVAAAMMPPDAASKIEGAMPKSGSWPSGRSTRVTASGIVLAALLPERQAAIWKRADEYAQSRVVAGMHYPSDLEAGRRAGTALAAILFTDPVFQADFAQAKTELQATLTP
ncbi:acid phosphatase [Azomonas macrocytogenes]|uniref:Acid phosphatase n=1 Tax=Azomonas macrocytogenes TaxID=69962 RepID=A0A839T2N3_AZOMA|nr:phosphatase PAP2 family protein [Azomonas macrocytogenes]MBB3101973.1 acid phosphatase (class A) [Azomonas macrocytogenes]